MSDRKAAIRLGTTGKATVLKDLDEIAASGDAGAKRMARAYQRASEEVSAALQRQAATASKLEAAYGGVTPRKAEVFAGNRDDVGKSARDSAAIFNAAYSQMEARARALVLAMDPVAAAQDRYNREIGEARGLVAAGVLSLDQYVAKLRQEKTALDAVSASHGRNVAGNGQLRAAMQGVSFQAQDTFTQLSMGANVFSVLAIQGGQLAGQFANVEGKAGSFARFMIGPWGLAITGGMLLLGALTKGLFENDKAADKAKNQQLSLSDALSKVRFGTVQAREALVQYNNEKKRGIEQDSLAVERNLADARSRLQGALATREQTKALLEKAIADADIARSLPGNAGDGGRGALGTLQVGRVDELRSKLALLTGDIGITQQAIRNLQKDVSDSAVKAVDPIEKINQRYRRMDDAAIRAANGNNQLSASLSATRVQIEKERRAAVEAEQAKQSALRETARVRTDSEVATAASIAKMLRSEIPGVRVTSTTGGKHTKNSYHYRNQAVDFVPAGGMGSMTKEDVRRIFNSRGIDIIELLGPGDKGHSDHFHVAWAKGKAALDEFSDAAKRADERARDLEALTGKYDPATAAAERYRDVLAEIDRLKPANADALRANALAEYRTARAGLLGERIGLDALGAGAKVEQDATDKAEAEQKRRADIVAQILGDQAESLAFTRTELGLVSANDNVRDATLAKVRLIAQLTRDKIDADSMEGRQIVETAAAYERLLGTLRTQSAAWAEIRGFGTDFVETVLSPATWEDWGEGGRNVLNMLKSEFVKLALLNPIKNLLFGESNATLSSVIGGLGSLFGGRSAALAGTYNPPDLGSLWSNPPAGAAGTPYTSGGDMLVGEFGREILRMPRGASITPAGETRRMMAANDAPPAQHTHFHLKGAVLTQDLLNEMNAIGAGAAVQGASGGAQMAEVETFASAARRLGSGRWG